MKTQHLLLAGALLAALTTPATAAEEADQITLNRGRFLLLVGDCNGCHTPGYAESDGATPPSQWLTGSPVGFSGPWGTTYPANLRLLAHRLSEQEWLSLMRAPKRPPMPTTGLRAMSDDDLLAVYRYVRSLGTAGTPAPAYVPPGGKVATPYFDFVPRNLPPQAHAAR